MNMKKLLLLFYLSIFTLSGFAQITNINFDGVKDYDNGYRIAYFQVSGINDDAQAYFIQKELIKDSEIKRIVIYNGNRQNRKGMLECKSNIDENILKNKMNDALNTFFQLKNNSSNLREFYLSIFNINNMPEYHDTGNRQEDVLKFKDEFERWKQENPDKYSLIRNIQLDIFIQ